LMANQTHVSGATWGTPVYMAPEILSAQHASTAADVYAFGVMLWELHEGQVAWDYLCDTGRVVHVRDVQGLQLREVLHFSARPASSPLYIALARKCLHLDPKARPTFAQVVDVLLMILQEHLLPSSAKPTRRSTGAQAAAAQRTPGGTQPGPANAGTSAADGAAEPPGAGHTELDALGQEEEEEATPGPHGTLSAAKAQGSSNASQQAGTLGQCADAESATGRLVALLGAGAAGRVSVCDQAQMLSICSGAGGEECGNAGAGDRNQGKAVVEVQAEGPPEITPVLGTSP